MQPLTSTRLGLAVGLLLLASAAQAALAPYTAKGVDLVYDDDYTPVGAAQPGLTWVADANLFKTQYDDDPSVVSQIIAAVPTISSSGGAHTVVAGDFNTTNGRMTWFGAMAWVEWLGSIAYGGADDWRLWSALDSDGTGPCNGLNCTDSELGDLFYTEGDRDANEAITSSPVLDDVFTNMEDFAYWSDTEFNLISGYVWIFVADVGNQSFLGQSSEFYGWAVRPGKIAAAPLPSTAMLLALGVLGLGAGRWQRRRQKETARFPL